MTKTIIYIITLLTAGLPSLSMGQVLDEDALQFLDEMPESVIDELEDHAGIVEQLQDLAANPMDINTVTERELQMLHILTPIEIKAILDYRSKSGPFINIHELQVVEGLKMDKIQSILPFLTVNRPGQPFLTHESGTGYLLTRTSGYFPLRKGFRSQADKAPAYQGSPLSLLIRYRQSRFGDYSYGISMKKDAGERFSFDKKPGFDSYHLHYFRTNRPGKIKTLALGDYRINLGQGLLQYHGFAITKSANPLLVKRVAPVIQPYSGTSEYFFFRGAAASLEIRPEIKTYLFVHRKKRDATLRDSQDANGKHFSAFHTSGLHRTQNEEEKRHQLSESIIGHRIEWESPSFRMGINTLYQHFSLPYHPVQRIDNVHRLNGQQYLSHSIDFSGYSRSLHYFGEIATQQYQTPAFTLTGLYSFHPKLDAGILIRRFPAYFAPVYGNTFSARTLPNNESGIYIGLNYFPTPQSNLSFYLDSWKGLWPTFQAHGPTFDQDVFLRYDISQKRKWEAYAQLKFKYRGDNTPHSFPSYNTVAYRHQSSIRIQYRRDKYQQWRWTHRLEWTSVEPVEGKAETGLMLFTDFLYRPLGSSWSIASRVAWFDTGSYASRIYALEPDILYSFNVPSFYGQGWRLSVRGSKKWRNGLRTELRTGWTFLPHAEEVGSGHNAVPGSFSQEMKVQVMYSF